MLDKFAALAALKPAKKRAAAAGPGANGDAGSGVVNLMRNPVRSATACLPDGAEQLAAMLEARALENEYGQHLSARKWFSEAIGHAAPDGDIDAAILNLLSPGACEGACDPSRWLFLDTETTGLTGGTGTYPFMVGIAWWDAGGLEVEQFFMRDHSEEHALLVTLAERIAERGVLVTFNGKSFDWPLLETRYRMTRKIKVPVLQAHLDFLHPARNLWRIRLGSVRLAELEKHVLGFHRGADIIGAMIPQFYFDYLRGGAVEPIVEIFKHNQTDLRGLAGLASRILAVLAEPEKYGKDPLELFGVSRICERRGETQRAQKHYAQSIEGDLLPAEADRLARRALARMAKRDGNLEQARAMWESMKGNSREGFEAFEQLAIYHEHVAGAPREAAALAKEALVELRRSRGVMSPALHRQYKEGFEHRLARLERKTAKTLLDVDGVDARA
jgi:uncharacterized protein YprB with RNaseH-like and TPR domain